MKKILLILFKKDSQIIKFLSLIKKSFIKSCITFQKIKMISFKYSIFFIPKIIEGQFFVEKNSNSFFEKKKYFDEKYKFSYGDWFSVNIPVWEKIISKFKYINYLEIGSFEGRSTVFISELPNTKTVMAVDTFDGSDEYVGSNKLNHIDFNIVFENFKNNMRLVGKKNINYLKDTSHNYFKNYKNKYNLIYIDGSHHYNDVKQDFINAYNCIEKDGIIILDDFLWFYYKDIKNNPIGAIIECYDQFKNNLKLIFVNHQIIFKKLI